MAIEAELKFDLQSEAHYDALRAALGVPVSVHNQTNHYYDTPGRELGAQRALLRIRTHEGEATGTITLKWDGQNSNGYQVAQEVEKNVSMKILQTFIHSPTNLEALCDEIANRISRWTDADQWEEVGQLANRREVFVPSGAEKWEVDRTELPGDRTDYELEIETQRPEEIRNEANALMARLGVPMVPQRKTKFARFLAAAGLA